MLIVSKLKNNIDKSYANKNSKHHLQSAIKESTVTCAMLTETQTKTEAEAQAKAHTEAETEEKLAAAKEFYWTVMMQVG